MSQQTKTCSKCGTIITEKRINKCPNCGAKISTPFYKKWWFWVIIVIFVIAIISGSGNNSDPSSSTSSNSKVDVVEKNYEEIDLQTMLDELNENALRAEKTYQNKNIKITGKIATFDSDGSYITIEPTNANEWNFDTVMCYIKKDSQLDYLLTKSKGDAVTIKGKVISIGEVLGYSINIDEVE